jgi:SAM-dependent methyltransferase
MMLSHPAAKLRLPPRLRGIAYKYGHIFVRFFGYPLDHTTRLRMRTVLSYLPKKKGKLLEIGCSFGVLAFELARRGYQVTGVDVNPISIQLANEINRILEEKNVCFANVDFIDNEFPAGEFDIVVTVEVLEHIRDDQRAIGEIHRILKDNGLLIVSVPYTETTQTSVSSPISSWRDFEGNPVTLGLPGESHFRNGYSREGLTSLLSSSGFSVIRCNCTTTITLPRSAILFPLCYVAALALGRLSKQKAKLTMLAKKERIRFS